MLTYFAHPIDFSGVDQGLSAVVEQVASVAAASGVNLYRPGTAYAVAASSPQSLAAVDRVNQAALRNCDSVLALLPSGVPTLGTPVEVDRAIRSGKPVVVVVTSPLQISRSVQLQGWISDGVAVFTVDTMPVGDDLIKLLIPNHPGDTMLVHRIHGKAVLPSRSYPDDVGLDLAASEEVAIPIGQSRNIPTGVRVAMPPNQWGMIVGRSSTWHRHKLLTIPGVIDAGWRGELFVAVYNIGGAALRVTPGVRLGQLIVLPRWSGSLLEVTDLPSHARGSKGFGSSGD